MKITIWTAVVQHKHGQNVYAATSEEGAEEAIAGFCKQWWDETVTEDNTGHELNADGDPLSADEYEEKHGRKAMIETYFNANNEFGGYESANITSDVIEVAVPQAPETLITSVKSLVSDIEAMQERPQTYPEQFGPFSEYDDDNGRNVVIEWPNLAISLAEVKKLLEPKTIEGELTKPQVTYGGRRYP